MSPTDLRSIRTFPSLVKYLRDELDWPIETDDFDDLTFDYRPEELGIDPKTAASIEEIKQLRPLVTNQPWGIFFIKFEPKRLPVVVLRRILRTLVIKKRASASKSHQATWNLHDLLFISSYGESDHRDITFAHFTEDDQVGDLPALRVLGWDDEDTVLHLEHAHKVLRQKLRWPSDPHQVDEWSEQWSSAFTLRHKEVITTSRDLAIQLARLATAIRKRVSKVLSIETESGPLHRLMKSFKKALIHDLYEEAFADMYAQTITYGLLSARVSRPAGLVAENITDMVPTTNPFLKELLSTFLTVGGRKGKIDFDELGINEVVQVLREANMEAILRDFGDRNPQEDPVIHFYELFLKEYNPKLRMQRGVFYTPRPVVSFIVRSVDEILRTEFGLEDGLADITTWGEMLKRFPEIKLPKDTDPEEPFVQILDPALGTGTFLVEVIDIIHKTMTEKWQKAGHSKTTRQELWNEYVPKHLLPRLYGFELLMAPYAIAHMKIGLKLWETGYRFGSDERAHIYLTNSLVPPSDIQMDLPNLLPALAHEAQAVNDVKRKKHFIIVIGNPPYSKSSQNQGEWIENLMEEYKRTIRNAETQIQALSDDYSKFIRFGHFILQESGIGILGYVTNNGYIDGPLFREMRNSMLSFFDALRVINLHGDSRKRFSPPEGKSNGNVFDIQQGVATSLLSRSVFPTATTKVNYAEIWGTREEKYTALQHTSASRIKSQALQPKPQYYLFVPVGLESEAEFHKGWHLYDIFGTGNPEVDNHESYGAGFVTQQDKFAIAFEPETLWKNIQEFLSPTADTAALWKKFEFCSTTQWNFQRAKEDLPKIDIKGLTKRCLYRPFDYRYTAFDRNICTILRKRITSQFNSSNLALLATRRITRLPFNNAFVTNIFAEYKVASHDRNTIVFPLWIKVEENEQPKATFNSQRILNLNPKFLMSLATSLRLRQAKPYGQPEGFTPDDILYYGYAVFHSPGYRSRYAEFLKIDFPRLPLTSGLELFRALAKLGGELVELHLMESPKLERHITNSTGKGNNEVVKVRYEDQTVWINSVQGFKGVPEDVWNFHIGGYQVCEKWLKDRKGRVLSNEDITHYHKIVVAIKETIRLMAEIDKTIEKHGGWPGAFTTPKT